MKTVLVWDEYGVFGLGLKNLLEAQAFCPKVVVTGDLKALVADQVVLESADLILWGVSDRQTDRDLSALSKVLARAPQARAICIVSRAKASRAAGLLTSPTIGLIYRETQPHDLALVVELALSCPDYVTLPRAPEILAAIVSGAERPDRAGVLAPTPMLADADGDVQFTVAQEKILRRLVEGKSNKEIARDLGLSDNTVRSHLYNVMQKCRVHSRRELALLVREGREQREQTSVVQRVRWSDEGGLPPRGRAVVGGSLP